MNLKSLLNIRKCSFAVKRLMCTPPAPGSSSAPSTADSMHNRYRPSNIEKIMLVWTKKYKSKEEVPSFVSADIIERSRSEARIKISNILIVLTCIASFGAILAGKAAAKRGESVHQMNLDWHKQYQEEHKAQEGTPLK